MTKIVVRSLPNAVSNSDVSDPTIRTKVMLLQENIRALASQLAEAQKAVMELQGHTSSDVSENVRNAINSAITTHDTDTRHFTTAKNNKLDGIESGAEVNVQSDWNETNSSSDAYIKNKPDIPVIPTWQYLSLTPIDASGTTGVKVQYNGSAAKSLNVITAHQDISGKLTTPSGGSNGQFLQKTSSGYGWATIDTSVPIKAKDFSATTSSKVSLSSGQTLTVTITESGYSPILISNVRCIGTEMGTYYDGLKSGFACTATTLSSTTASFDIKRSIADSLYSIVRVSFTVLYVKS